MLRKQALWRQKVSEDIFQETVKVDRQEFGEKKKEIEIKIGSINLLVWLRILFHHLVLLVNRTTVFKFESFILNTWEKVLR